jgi:hypothetical protein
MAEEIPDQVRDDSHFKRNDMAKDRHALPLLAMTKSFISLLLVCLMALSGPAQATLSWPQKIMEATRPGYLVNPILHRMTSLKTQADFERLKNVYEPTLAGVFSQISPQGLAPSKLEAFSFAKEILQYSMAIMTFKKNLLERLSLLVTQYFQASYDAALQSEWLRFGRWADMAPTLSQPWVWERTGLDVMGMSKIIPFGPLPLPESLIKEVTSVKIVDEHEITTTREIPGEMIRSNMGARTNKLFLVINWFHVARKILTDPALVGHELLMDLGEIIRGPLTIGTLLCQNEGALAYRAIIAYIAELYEGMNRNRKLASLHSLGSSYLYPAMNIVAVPLFILDFNNFYINSVKAGWAEMTHTPAYTPRFYALAFYNLGKTLSPAFTASQFYVSSLSKNTASLLAPLTRLISGTWIQTGIDYIVALALQLPPLAASHHFMERNGATIYNFGMYLTGAAGTVIAGTILSEQFLQETFYEKTYSWLATLTGLALYTFMYSKTAENIKLSENTSLKRVFVNLQIFTVMGFLVYDYLLDPLYGYLAGEVSEL